MKLKIATVVTLSLALVVIIPLNAISKETIPVSMSTSNVKTAYFKPTLEEKQQQAKAREDNDRQEEEARQMIARRSAEIAEEKRLAAEEARRIAEEEARLIAEQAMVYTSNLSLSEYEAKEWIAMKESGGDYNAVSPTGKYIGRYQLTYSYLNGDYSIENQERVADEYVLNRYGSWSAAQQFWVANGWY